MNEFTGNRIKTITTRYLIEDAQDWRGEINNIPFIKFPKDWEIQVIPPFGDAVVRFRVKLPDDTYKSVYLDSRMSLGYMEEPYWEVYPVYGDTERCYMNDIAGLLRIIATQGEKL